MKHDIALVRLDRKTNETDWGLNDPKNVNTICPICLPGELNFSEFTYFERYFHFRKEL